MNRTGTFCERRKAGIRLLSILLSAFLLFGTLLPGATAFAAADDGLTTLSVALRGADGKKYTVTASYPAEAGIPADAVLSVQAISDQSEGFNSYVAKAEQELHCSIDRETEIQLFDIAIVSGEDASAEYQPAEGTAVNMTVKLAEAPETEFGVVHFGEETERLDSEVEGRTLTFDATGFSVYAFVAVSGQDGRIYNVDEFAEGPVYLSATTKNGNTYYLSSGTNYKNTHGTVINRTAVNTTEGAVAYTFEPLAGTDNQFYMYLTDENDIRQYVKLTKNTNAEYVTSAANATALTIAPCGEALPNTFSLSFVQDGVTYYLNLRKDENGSGFNGSDYKPGTSTVQADKESLGSVLTAYHYLPTNNDLLNMDGLTYGIAWPLANNTASAVTATANNASTLVAHNVPSRANPLDNSEDVMIHAGSDIDMFTFRLCGDNEYYVTTVVGGATKYLRIAAGGAVSFVDTPDEYCVIKISSGLGNYAGKLKFTGKKSGYSLSINDAGTVVSGKNGNSQNEYFLLAEKTNLGDDDFVSYTAIKTTISKDKNGNYPIKNGMSIIVYTRIWNENTKEYEFYAIDHDGSLKRVYDEGDTIRWAGAQINTLLWKFTEYYYWPYIFQIPNYYYELQNVYSGKYIAPQVHTGQILSNRTIGVNLNGRRYGEYYSTILAWDDYRYDYAGLKTADDNSSVVSVPMSKAQDFYFAIMDDPVPEEFSTVETVDNAEYGIKMRMINFQGEKYEGGGRDRSQTNVMGAGTEVFNNQNPRVPLLDLVSTDLQDDGYPLATRTNKSLEELFGEATDVNHLFLKSTYGESGYFEYDCTQTFATLLENGNFRVYNQIGTVETSTNSQGHGWFMPFNDIDPNVISAYTNVTDVHNQPLSSNDPRLGEQLYSIPKSEAQYHFGMEMEASFVQSKSGLDAWGHDIIFEFAGDDDMWLYVDGELVLDLGGVHSALVGKINFRTGDVTIPDPATGAESHTTLRALFEQNYRQRNPEATEEQVAAHLDRIFTEGTSVFKDYSSHTMKMYYMERGAGASNLHMRFNLTTATDGQLLLSKTVSGTDKQDYTSARFAYQIHYYDKDYADWRTVRRTAYSDEGTEYFEYNGVTSVNYQGKKEPVDYADSYEGYTGIFFLKPGETAEIQFPDDETEYYITECNVDTRIYDQVTANDTVLTGDGAGNFKDFATWREMIGQRKVVNFDNHVSPDALRMLSITKNLYDEKGQQIHYDVNDPDNDDTGFRFRVYIGENENGEPEYYRMDSYYVKDPDGNYCRYDYDAQRFESLGKTAFEQLTEEDLEICTFTTSPSGAVDKIPNDFTVEIRNLLVDTKFYIEEREADIPKGYDLVGYDRVDGSYIVEDGDTVNSGVVRDSASPHIIVKNHRGWGLSVEKVWSDDSFMLSHDNIYFAVYCNNTLVDGTVRRMKTAINDFNDPYDEAETSLYFYFAELQADTVFTDYTVKEVIVTGNFTVDENGYVTGYDTVTPIAEGGTLTNGGVSSQTGEHGTFAYTVSYDVGLPAGPAKNVRTDTVTNVRPGVRILKVDGNGAPLANAVFTLTGGSGDAAISQTYTSNSAGLVTFAYPEQDVAYTLTETGTPDGYSAIIDSITFTLGTGGLSVSGTESGAVTVSGPDAAGTVTITVKNYKSTIKAVKVDSSNANRYVEGAHFALYRQVMGKNGPIRDYYPLIGYEDLVSDANGVIPGIDGSLPAGTYYLSETQAPRGYYLPDHDILFTLDDTDNITILSPAEDGCSFTRVLNENNEQICTLLIPNRRTMKSITLTPQTLVADFGLYIDYNVKENNYLVSENSAYHYIGICAMEYYDELGSEEAPGTLLAAAGTAYRGAYGTLTLAADGSAHYEIDTMAFKGEDEFCLVAQVTQIAGEAANVYVYEKLTYIPATTVYYEDDFTAESAYHDGVESTVTGYNFGKWSRVTSGSAQTLQAADLASHSGANIFGYDPHYTEFATYSNNSAHRVSVADVNGGNANKNWPYMEFDFAGTGFDLVSVTGCDTGMFAVRVYETATGTDGTVTVGRRVKNTTVDTYYGYDYGELYLDAGGAVTLTKTDRPLYEATDEIVAAGIPSNVVKASGKYFTPTVTYYDTASVPTETPHYRDANGKITAKVYYVNTENASDVRAEIPRDTDAQYVPNYAYARAEGWLVSSTADQSLYQIPVIKIRDLPYGTYRAQIEPRFTTRYGHYQTVGDYKYFDLYVDAIRIYDPAGSGNDGTLTSAVIQDAYNYSNEAYETFTTLKNVIVGAETMGADNESQEGLVVVDGGVPLNTDRINDYVQFGPNSELYLGKGMSVAFQINASEIPADVQLQLKKISASIPTLRVTYNNGKTVYSKDVQIRTATDLSYSILNMIGRDNIKWTKKNGVVSSGTVIITNVGEDESLISATNLKWTFQKAGSGFSVVNKSGTVVVSNSTVSGVKKALAFSRKNTAVTAAGEEPATYANGAVTMTVTTASEVESLVVRDAAGNVIDEDLLDITFSEIDDTRRQWTVTLLESEDDDYTYLVAAASDGLVSGEPLKVSVRVENALPEAPEPAQGQDPGTDEGTQDPQQTSGSNSIFERIRSILLRFVDLLRIILSFFGINI